MSDTEPKNGTPMEPDPQETLERARHVLGQLDEMRKAMARVHQVTKLDDSGHITRSMLRTEMKRIDANVSGIANDVKLLYTAVAQLEEVHNTMAKNMGTLSNRIEMIEKAVMTAHIAQHGSGPTA